jgi:hypothetical protein
MIDGIRHSPPLYLCDAAQKHVGIFIRRPDGANTGF